VAAEWDSGQYLKFEKERTQPAVDLARKIQVKAPKKIVDIGCGPGNSTAVLREQFPDSYLLGVDNSPQMVASAKEKYPDLDFSICDISQDLCEMDTDFDIVFSNACIQWVPDHPKVIKSLMGLLKKGGVLAIQIPVTFDEPIHQSLAEISTNEKWGASFHNPRNFYTLQEGEYYDVLSSLTPDFSIWKTIYFHKMQSHQGMIEWYRGTGLRPYLSALPDDKKADFEKDIYEELVRKYPVQENGDIIFRFPRLFFTAVKM